MGAVDGLARLREGVEHARQEGRADAHAVVADAEGDGRALARGVKSVFDFKYEDFEIVGYDPHPGIKAPVAI